MAGESDGLMTLFLFSLVPPISMQICHADPQARAGEAPTLGLM